MSGLYEAASQSFSSRLRPPVAGGAERQDSVRSGLEALAANPPDRVLIHDAARPFVEPALITRVIASLDQSCRRPPLRAGDRHFDAAKRGRVTGTLPRDELWRAQTPQGFRFDAILAAHRAAAKEASAPSPTMPASRNGSVSTSLWSKARKQTASSLRQRTSRAPMSCCGFGRRPALGTQRVATGYDVHAFGPGDAVILCGVRIPHDRKLIGHSDADVGMHALTDALLGTIADGDIGVHFPPSDARWRGAASELFLKDAAARVKARGGEIVHVDVTFICEGPRIGPHRDAMRAKLAECLGLDVAADQHQGDHQ